MKRRLTLIGLALAVALSCTAAAAPSASASFHLIKISEVFPGTGPEGDDAFIELQMYAAGQNQVGPGSVCYRYYTEADASTSSGSCLSGPVDNGENQRTVLIGDLDLFTEADFQTNFANMFQENETNGYGAVCVSFSGQAPVDCVSWGAFTAPGPLLDGGIAGTPEAALPAGMSATRSISAGCPTLLEASDDTDDSAADFAPATPTPRGNAQAVTGLPCGNGGGAVVKCGGLNATKQGTAGANVLVGTGGRDVIAGLGGNDTIRGLAGNDVLCGGGGRDRLIGGGGRDRLLGQAGRDTCKGGPKRDIARTCETKRTI